MDKQFNTSRFLQDFPTPETFAEKVALVSREEHIHPVEANYVVCKPYFHTSLTVHIHLSNEAADRLNAIREIILETLRHNLSFYLPEDHHLRSVLPGDSEHGR